MPQKGRSGHRSNKKSTKPRKKVIRNEFIDISPIFMAQTSPSYDILILEDAVKWEKCNGVKGTSNNIDRQYIEKKTRNVENLGEG